MILYLVSGRLAHSSLFCLRASFSHCKIMARTRGYCFTINNPSDDDYQEIKLLKDIAKYLIVGKEFGEEKTLHYQGYVYLAF